MSPTDQTSDYRENFYSAGPYADMLLTEPISPHAVSAESSPTYLYSAVEHYLDLQWTIERQSNFPLSSQEPQIIFEEKPLLSVRIPYECSDSQCKKLSDIEKSPAPTPSSAVPNSSGTLKPKRARTTYTTH
ncbi:unnamed protein product [Acanthoscelides obtectus]|uniref:Uncharacterized protein n=1 Tax=Acanthoscelides obtectus TaxID=200917 RepID=A0A9P0MBV7_ACAOB|nr:unnamed protein product [Acanthoscelides obtectus]CAK1654430.1 hypothetical protein AOBTE_LOCUS18586 [Acanthoscelides obtectus]